VKEALHFGHLALRPFKPSGAFIRFPQDGQGITVPAAFAGLGGWPIAAPLTRPGTVTPSPHLGHTPARPAILSGALKRAEQFGQETGIGIGHLAGVPKKKERRTRSAQGTPAKGLTERHLAEAPLRGRGPSTASVRYKGPEAQVGGFPEAVLDARASFNLSSRPHRATVIPQVALSIISGKLWRTAPRRPPGLSLNPNPGNCQGGREKKGKGTPRKSGPGPSSLRGSRPGPTTWPPSGVARASQIFEWEIAPGEPLRGQKTPGKIPKGQRRQNGLSPGPP
jgi:hypothetical protein